VTQLLICTNYSGEDPKIYRTETLEEYSFGKFVRQRDVHLAQGGKFTGKIRFTEPGEDRLPDTVAQFDGALPA